MKIEAIDLFCGIGGLTYGLCKAGIQVLAGIDNDASCQYSYTKNNKAKFIHSDIATCNFQDLKNLYSKNSLKILVGCAPCQPFSSHSFKYKQKVKDDRWHLIDYFTQAMKIIQPDIISVENVRGFTKADIFRKFLKDVEEMGYEINQEIVYCPDYGIPQRRSRLVLLGSKSKIGKIEIPTKTHNKNTYCTVESCIKDLPQIKSGERHAADPLHYSKGLSEKNMKRLQQSRPGGTWKDWDKTLLPNCYKKETGKTYTSVYGRMEWNKVAPTITTQFYNYGSGRFGHPEQDRALSLREGALLQTFPHDYDFGSNISLIQIGRHIGNAVPPKLGEVIGKQIIEHIKRRQL